MQESSRDEHRVYCEDNESVRVDMPKQGSAAEFKEGQNQFKVPFIMTQISNRFLTLWVWSGPGLHS